MRKIHIWLIWFLASALLASYYAYALVGADKTPLLPGTTSSGHYQIEMKCEDCHSDGFSGTEGLQKACVKCHGAELKAVKDSHPKSKFTDPRNADRVAILDARLCITCHREHQPGITGTMGVTLPQDFCQLCHFDIAKDRASHKGMAFDTCADGGCHNFHDNKALYEDFLVKHTGEADVLSPALLPKRDLAATFRKNKKQMPVPLRARDQDAPATQQQDKIITQWAGSRHAAAAVNCSDCHADSSSAATGWTAKPTLAACRECHELENAGFLLGKHGMRLAQDLPPMRAELARLPMKEKRQHEELGCLSCHADHGFDTTFAAVQACVSCHDDDHTLAYKRSRHYQLLEQEQAGKLPPGSGVSCANCHLPREARRHKGIERILVQHNQNQNLRPNEKMIREVCMNCHGLQFSLDALADPDLVANNFSGKPKARIKSIEMAKVRELTKKKEKRNKDKN